MSPCPLKFRGKSAPFVKLVNVKVKSQLLGVFEYISAAGNGTAYTVVWALALLHDYARRNFCLKLSVSDLLVYEELGHAPALAYPQLATPSNESSASRGWR